MLTTKAEMSTKMLCISTFLCNDFTNSSTQYTILHITQIHVFMTCHHWKNEAFPVVEKVQKKPKIDISKLVIDSDESESSTHCEGQLCRQHKGHSHKKRSWKIKTEYCVVDSTDESMPRRNIACGMLGWETFSPDIYVKCLHSDRSLSTRVESSTPQHSYSTATANDFLKQFSKYSTAVKNSCTALHSTSQSFYRCAQLFREKILNSE